MELAERNTTELKAMDSTEVQVVSDKRKVVQHKQMQEISNQPLPVGGIKKSCYRCRGQDIPEFLQISNRNMSKVWQDRPYSKKMSI